MSSKKFGFTLIEILVVIAILSVIVGFLVTNLSGARGRAQDAKKKAELREIKTGLQLYFTDYRKYPTTGNGLTLNACGPDGTSSCPYCATADFASGGPDGCQKIYVKKLTRSGNYFTFRYYPCEGGDSYRLKINLDNASDADILPSQAACPANSCTTYSPKDYVLCGD